MITGRKLGSDNAIVFANLALINTQVNVDITLDVQIISAVKERITLEVYNPSTVTDLTVKLQSIALALGGDTRYVFIDSFTVPKTATITGTEVNAYLKLIEGTFVGTNIRLVFSNDTALGAAEGFTAYARLREV